MNNVKLDKDEQDVLRRYEAGEFESTLTDARREQIRDAAKKLSRKIKESTFVSPVEIWKLFKNAL